MFDLRRHGSWLAIVWLAAGTAAAAPGGLGALCDTRSPCGEGLTCRDGFCLRLEEETPPEPPATTTPAAPEGDEADPPVAPAAPPADRPVEPPPEEAPPAAPLEVTLPSTPRVPVTSSPPPEAAAPATPLDDEPATTPEAPATDAPPPLDLPQPPSSPEPEPPPIDAEKLVDDAGGQLWGGAGARGIATPSLMCGGCLLGAGACTALGGWTFLDAADRGTFTEFSSSNDNARIGGYIGLAVGALASLVGAPLFLVGQAAAVYAAFLDVSLCGSALGLDDPLVIGLAGGRGAAWTLAPQLLGCSAALCGSGAWVWVAANGVNAYPDTDRDARMMLNGYQATAIGLLATSTIPLGLALVSAVTGIGLDFATLLRANAIAESKEPAAEASVPLDDHAQTRLASSSFTAEGPLTMAMAY